jgi:hypothetical protein
MTTGVSFKNGKQTFSWDDCCCFDLSVETHGYDGGDGDRATLTFRDRAGTCTTLLVTPSGEDSIQKLYTSPDGFSLTLQGDSEVQGFVEMLRRAINALDDMLSRGRGR